MKRLQEVFQQNWLAILKKTLRVLGIPVAGSFLIFLGAGIHLLNQKPDLSVWLTSNLDEEFTTRPPVSNFLRWNASF